jgi:hypothetical protein
VNTSLKNLQIQRLVQEYSYLILDDQYKKEIVNTYQTDFLNLVNGKIELPEVIETEKSEKQEDKKDENREQSEEKEKIKKDPIVNPDIVSKATKDKVKKIFRDIAKLTHPDKVDDENLTSLYIEAKIAYDNYDLFELYFISNKLNIILDLAEDDINVLTILIDHKKNSLKGIETSFIWKWVHTNDEEQKEKIINDFVDINYKQYKK